MPDARQAPGPLPAGLPWTSLPGQAFPDPQLSVPPAHDSLPPPPALIFLPHVHTQKDLLHSCVHLAPVCPQRRTEFHEGRHLVCLVHCRIPSASTAQAPSAVSWVLRNVCCMGGRTCRGRQQRHRGYPAWFLPQELSGSSHAWHWTKTIRTVHVVVTMQGGNSEEGCCSRLEESGGLHGGGDRSAGRPGGFTDSLTLRVGRA